MLPVRDGGGEVHGWQRQAKGLARAPRTAGLERIEAYFGGRGYEMHRHDTYAIGRTLSGVQSFHYRRGLRHSLPGGTLVLHPDEAHDGRAGTDAGFRYRMLYVEPALVQRMPGGQPLPFVPGGLSDDPRLRAAAEPLLRTMSQPLIRWKRRTRSTIWRKRWPPSPASAAVAARSTMARPSGHASASMMDWPAG